MNKRIQMNKLRELLRLFELGKSQREISRTVSVSRPVVSEYIQQFKLKKLTFEEIKNISDDALLKALELSTSLNKQKKYLELLEIFPGYLKELKRVGVTLLLLWEEYKRLNTNGYGYSQFCHHYRTWEKTKDITMHIEHKYGDKMFVDFTGKKLRYWDIANSREIDVEVYVSILGGSQLTYVEAVASQKKSDFIKASENSMRYFGGTPKAIVPDCLKSAVTKGSNYEPDINPDFADFARHYNTTILPARPYHPKDKAHAEKAVNIIYSRIFAPMRDRVFTSIEELNQAIWELLKEHNNKKMKQLNCSRREMFEEHERKELGLLPAVKYELKSFAQATVQRNWHVYLREDKHYYSVPFRLVRLKTTLIYTDWDVEVFYRNERVAVHKRDRSQNRYTTNMEHAHPSHRFVAEWNPEKILSRASDIGTEVQEISSLILRSDMHPEQAYKICMGILSLSKSYCKERLNKACRHAINYQEFTYRFVKNTLMNGMDNIEDEEPESNILYHDNIRGKEYYIIEEIEND